MTFCRKAALSIVIAVGGCAAEPAAEPDAPVAILEKAPDRPYEPVWPISARAEASAGESVLDEKLRDEAREMGADAVIVERRYFDPSPPADEGEAGLGSSYPELFGSFDRGAFPQATIGARVYGPYVIAEGLAIRYPGSAEEPSDGLAGLQRRQGAGRSVR
jgi:hypothetical protein